jgi:hypothetical protein
MFWGHQVIVCPGRFRNRADLRNAFSKICAQLALDTTEMPTVKSLRNDKLGDLTILFVASYAKKGEDDVLDVAGRRIKMVRGLVFFGRAIMGPDKARSAFELIDHSSISSEFDAFWDQRAKQEARYSEAIDISDISEVGRTMGDGGIRFEWRSALIGALICLVPYMVALGIFYFKNERLIGELTRQRSRAAELTAETAKLKEEIVKQANTMPTPTPCESTR